MVRKRGGTTGQGGGKRTATSPPVGATYKDSRRNIQGDEDFDDEDVVIHNKQKNPEKSMVEQMNQATLEKIAVNQQSRKSKSGSVVDMLNERASLRGSVAGSVRDFATVAATSKKRGNLGVDSLYKTPDPEGCMRDVLTVEVETKDREPYRGTVTYQEAKYEIFLEALDLPEELLHGVKIQFGSGPTITYKLTEQIDVDTLAGVEFFEFKRRTLSGGQESFEYFGCRLKGIRARRQITGIVEEDETEANVFDVTISGCDYCVEEGEMKEWLSIYGEVFGNIAENTHIDEKPNAKPTGNGTYTTKMRIDNPIPQFLPMCGKKVRVDYRGQQTLCTNCYGKHPRKYCKSDKVGWMEYVVHFMRTNENVTNEMIGRWFDIAQKEKRVPRNERPRHEERTFRIETQTVGLQRAREDKTYGEKQRPQSSNYPPTNSSERREVGNQYGRAEKTRLEEKVVPASNYQRRGGDTKKPAVDNEKLQMIVKLREESENPERMNRLIELTEIGLSIDAAREIHDNEMEIEKINKLIGEKKKSSVAKRPDFKKTTREEKDGEADNAFEW